MDPTIPVYDISSDEEQEAFEVPATGDDDHKWLTEILDTFDKVDDDDDSDDVVIVGEYKPPKSKPRKSSVVVNANQDDDDCVVLEVNPDKTLAIADSGNKNGDDGGGDSEVMVLGQKGEIACRDYPHLRHDCAEFPFSSTPHDKHCEMCHCYVCDSLAPCAFWGTGCSSADHCHANDKQEDWKSLRKKFRQLKDPRESVSHISTLSNCNGIVAWSNHVASPGGMKSLQNSTAQNGFPVQPTIQACSSSTTFGLPNILSRGRDHSILDRNAPLPPLFLTQSQSVFSNSIRRSNLPDRMFVSSSTGVKRSGTVRSSISTTQSIYASSKHTTSVPVSQHKRSAASLNTASVLQDSVSILDFPPRPHHKHARSNTCDSIVNAVSLEPGISYTLSINSQNGHQMQTQSNLLDTVETISSAPVQARPDILRDTEIEKDPDFENWFLNPTIPPSLEGSLHSPVFSPDLHSPDTSLHYFDYGSTWDGLTNV